MPNFCQEAVEPGRRPISARPKFAMPNSELVAEQGLSGLVAGLYPSVTVEEDRRASGSFECADFVFRARSANLIGDTHNSGHAPANLGHQPDGFRRKWLRTPKERHAPVTALRGKNS